MGASESRPLGDDSEAPKRGYHVVRVAAGSPAHQAGIEPFFDFCVGIDGVALDPATDADADADAAGLGAWKSIEAREGSQVLLNVWSSKRQELRTVPIVPSRAWSASPAKSDAQPSLLGLSLRLCNPSQALSHVWHILEILEGSPAESAGLVPFGDFVIGWTGGVLRSEGDFYELVEAHVDRALRLYVYNSDYDHTREVIIVPNREWGGEGLLGCGVGYGLLRTYLVTLAFSVFFSFAADTDVHAYSHMTISDRSHSKATRSSKGTCRIRDERVLNCPHR